MTKASAFIGMVAGAAIIILGIFVMGLNPEFTEGEYRSVSLEEFNLSAISDPEAEIDQWYGGDAYTGIQQAASQTANNLIPVYRAVKDGTKALKAVNDNLIKQSSNMTDNLEEKAYAEAENIKALANLIKMCFAYLILAIGLLVEIKYLIALITAAKKKEPVMVPPAPPYMGANPGSYPVQR